MNEAEEVRERMKETEKKLKIQEERMVNMFNSALTEGLEDKTGITKIVTNSFAKFVTQYTELCKEYGKLLQLTEGI